MTDEVEEAVEVEPLGDLQLAGFSRAVPAFNVLALRAPWAGI